MSKTTPRLSVIIPCYNGERFIGDAVASVCAQRGADLEVIVVDDGSKDGSAAMVKAVGDPRVRLLHHDHNRGIAAARNTGLAAARGAIVAFLDQDDVWLPGRLEAQLAELDRGASRGVGLVFCDVVNRDLSGREWSSRARVPRRVHALDTEALLARVIADPFLNLGSAVIDRSAVEAAGRFDETVRGGADDFDLIVRLAEQTRFAHVPRALFARRLHGDNFTDPLRMTEEAVSAIDGVEQRHPGLRRAARIGRARMVYRRAAALHQAGARRRAAADFRRALAQWPLLPRAWIGVALCALGPAGDAAVRLWVRLRGMDR